jgi:hypothetical protein
MGYRSYILAGTTMMASLLSDSVLQAELRGCNYYQKRSLSMWKCLALIMRNWPTRGRPKLLKDLLLSMKAEVERANAVGQHELDLLVVVGLLRCHDELLTQGYLANPPAAAPKKSEQGKRTPGDQAKPGSQSVGSILWE